MEQKFAKGSDEWLMFTEYWAMCQKYWLAEHEKSDYWQQMMNAVDQFSNKYQTEFAKDLALALMKECERKYKAIKY